MKKLHKLQSLLMGMALLLSVFGVSYTKKPAPGTPLTVMTWNILHGNDRTDAQKEQIASFGADLVLLQEVDIGTRRIGGGNNLADLSACLYENTLYGVEANFDTGTVGIGMMANSPLEEVQYLPGKDYVEVHNGYIYAKVTVNGVPLSVYEVHLNYNRSDWRAQQLFNLSIAIASDKNKYIIVAGDFNLHDFDELDVLAGLTPINSDETYYATYHGLDWDMQAIDNILYTADTLQLEEVTMPVNGLSDHNALVAKFTVRG